MLILDSNKKPVIRQVSPNDIELDPQLMKQNRARVRPICQKRLEELYNLVEHDKVIKKPPTLRKHPTKKGKYIPYNGNHRCTVAAALNKVYPKTFATIPAYIADEKILTQSKCDEGLGATFDNFMNDDQENAPEDLAAGCANTIENVWAGGISSIKHEIKLNKMPKSFAKVKHPWDLGDKKIKDWLVNHTNFPKTKLRAKSSSISKAIHAILSAKNPKFSGCAGTTLGGNGLPETYDFKKIQSYGKTTNKPFSIGINQKNFSYSGNKSHTPSSSYPNEFQEGKQTYTTAAGTPFRAFTCDTLVRSGNHLSVSVLKFIQDNPSFFQTPSQSGFAGQLLIICSDKELASATGVSVKARRQEMEERIKFWAKRWFYTGDLPIHIAFIPQVCKGPGKESVKTLLNADGTPFKLPLNM